MASTDNVTQPSIDRQEHREIAGVGAKAAIIYGYIPGTNTPILISAIDNLDGTYSLKTSATFAGTLTSSPTFKNDPTSVGETAKYGKVDSDYLVLVGKIYDYQIADEDSAGLIKYFGFLKPSGKWYILRQDTTLAATTGTTYRYSNGASSYATNWTGRAGLTYGLLSTLTGL